MTGENKYRIVDRLLISQKEICPKEQGSRQYRNPATPDVDSKSFLKHETQLSAMQAEATDTKQS
jgi:hypothetical protein